MKEIGTTLIVIGMILFFKRYGKQIKKFADRFL